MKLRDFLERESKKIIGFSKEAGVSPVTLHNVLVGKRDLRLSIALKIERASKGEVTCLDLCPEHLLVKYPKNIKAKEKEKKHKKINENSEIGM